VENGNPSVAMGIYVQVLRVLGLVEDLGMVAKEDTLPRIVGSRFLLPASYRSGAAIARSW
jgi:hypothetical protein